MHVIRLREAVSEASECSIGSDHHLSEQLSALCLFTKQYVNHTIYVCITQKCDEVDALEFRNFINHVNLQIEE